MTAAAIIFISLILLSVLFFLISLHIIITLCPLGMAILYMMFISWIEG